MTEEIAALAGALVHPAEEQRELLRILAASAQRELTGQLKEGHTPESCGEPFLCAAAMLAAADFGLLTDAGNGVMSFSAGSVSVSTGGGERTEKLGALLRRQARRMLRGYVQDEGFAFQGVKG